MAHELTQNDGLVLAGSSAWHGLGTVVEQAPTVWGGFKIAGLDWEVEQHPIGVSLPVGADARAWNAIDTHVANVRSDTREVLGVVGSGWKPVQNRETAEFIEALTGRGNVARLESAGSIRGGRRIWFLVRSATMIELGRGGEDRVQPYFLFANGHDGSLAWWGMPTATRVVCSNTFHAALANRKGQRRLGKAISIRHTGEIKSRLDEARRVLGIFGEQTEEFAGAARSMVAKKLDKSKAAQYFANVYTGIYGPPPIDPKTEKEIKSRQAAVDLVQDWDVRRQNEANTVAGVGGTLWSAFNAVTEWANHGRNTKGGKEGREQAILFGGGAEAGEVALEQALALL